MPVLLHDHDFEVVEEDCHVDVAATDNDETCHAIVGRGILDRADIDGNAPRIMLGGHVVWRGWDREFKRRILCDVVLASVVPLLLEQLIDNRDLVFRY